MGINAFIRAARKVRPGAEIKVVWVNSWYDPGKKADATKALIDQGCDVITQHTDSPAPIQTAGSRGVWCFGHASDPVGFAPDWHATATLAGWPPYDTQRVQEVLDGTRQHSDGLPGLQEGLMGEREDTTHT